MSNQLKIMDVTTTDPEYAKQFNQPIRTWVMFEINGLTIPVDLSVAKTILENGIGVDQKHVDQGIADWESLFKGREEYIGKCCLSFSVKNDVKIIISKEEAIDFLSLIKENLISKNLL